MMIDNSNNKRKAGYRVHFDRLRDVKAPVKCMRTHKYLCEIPSEEAERELKEKFDKVAKVVDSSEEGSLLWFLVQLYGLGFLFVPKAGQKNRLLYELDNKFEPSELKQLKSAATLKFKSNVNDWWALLDFLTTTPRQVVSKIQNGFLPNSIISSLGTIFHPDENITKENLFDFPQIKKSHDELRDLALERRGLSENDIQEYFNAEIKKEDIGITFAIQKVDKQELKKNINKGVTIYDAYFRYLQTASQHTGRDIQSLAGVDDNQNALSNFFNKALTEFQLGEKACKDLIYFGNPQLFDDSSELLNLISKAVFDLAKKVSVAKDSDFICNNWYKYRTLVGGRLQGWLSNFQNRIKDYTDALSYTVHRKELNEWNVPENVRDYLLEEKDDDFVFKNSLPEPNELNKKEFQFADPNTGEIIEEKNLEEFYFWGKGNQKGPLQTRFYSIRKSTKELCRFIKENCDFENIFPNDFKNNFYKLQALQDPLLTKLRSTTLGINDQSGDERDIGTMLDEYRSYIQPVREFLMKWNNEGITVGHIVDGEEIKFKKVESSKQNEEKHWISNKLLTKPKKDKGKVENERKIIGYFSKEKIPQELARYPRFLYQGQKPTEHEKEIADGKALVKGNDVLVKLDAARKIVFENCNLLESICSSTESQINVKWANNNWCVKNKNERIVWHFGALHKSLDALRKIAIRAKNPKQIIDFLNKFIISDENSEEWNKYKKTLSDGGYTKYDLKKEFDQRFEFCKSGIHSGNINEIKFYLSGYEFRDKQRVLAVKAISHFDFIEKFERHFGLQKKKALNFEHFLELHNGGASGNSLTRVELLKFWWSRRLMPLTKDVSLERMWMKLNRGDRKKLEENVLAGLFFNVDADMEVKNKVKREDLYRFIQAGLASDLRAKIGTLSRRNFIERNVISVENGAQTLIRYIPIEWGDLSHLSKKAKKRLKRRRRKRNKDNEFGFSHKAREILKNHDLNEGLTNQEIAEEIWGKSNKEKNTFNELVHVLAEMPHRWEFVLRTKGALDEMEPLKEGLFFEKSESSSKYNLRNNVERGSYYYSYPVKTSVVQKQFLERFLWGDKQNVLTEKIQGSSIILEQKKIIKWNESKPVLENDKLNFFIAMPFEFSKEYKRSDQEKKDKDYRNDNNILGIDLGEYGFGWAVFDPEKEKFIDMDFEHLPLLQKMRDKAASWKDTQSKGIFSRPTTYLADIREQAAGAARNQIHRLAMKYDAKPIYEDSVDGFESGGQRISKLYKTLKTADVYAGGQSSADEAFIEHIWGNRHVNIGAQIGASKTSQTCRNCGRCATAEIEGQKDNQLLVVNSIVLDLIQCDLPDGRYDKKEIAKKIKKSQRGEGKQAEHGTQSQFTCQYKDCQNSTHADEQAAQNIALKYYFAKSDKFDEEREKMKKEDEFKDRVSITLPFFLKKSKEERYKTLKK